MANKALGLTIPLIDGNNGYFDTTYDSFSNERTKIINLVSTVEGERFMQPMFGLGIHKYLFEQVTSDIPKKIKNEISKKVTFWLPNVNLDNTTVDIVENVNKNQIDITIEFSLKSNPTDYDILTFRF